MITNLRLRYQALVQKELDRAYDDGTHPDAKNLNRDLVERAEEAERMREHIVKEMDKNKDRMISKDEFLERVQLILVAFFKSLIVLGCNHPLKFVLLRTVQDGGF